MKTPKVAIVHDWLVGGGAEKVVLELHRIFPDAPIYTSYCTDEWRVKLNNKVVTGYLQYFGKLRKFLPLLQYLWFRSLKLKSYDIIISSAGNGMAKAVRAPKGTTHICYCHTPVHYLWRHFDRYMARPGFGPLNGLARLGLRLLAAPLKKLDFNAAQRVDYFLANSNHIRSDIAKYYKKDATILFPPIDTNRFEVAAHGAQPRHGFVTAGRLVPMKRTDIIVQACTSLNLPLTVIGNGPDLARLKSLAGPTVSLLGRVSDEQLNQAFATAEAFLFASYEDFGIAPVEAMSAGIPVIGYQAAGTLDYIVPGKTGEFFADQTVESLQAVLEKFDASHYNNQEISAFARRFSTETFHRTVTEFIANLDKQDH